MSYYAISNNNAVIAEKESALAPYYKNIKELPADYYDRKYIVSGDELVIDEDAEKDAALAELDNQFRIDQATIMEYFTQAVFDGDTEAQADLKEEMEEIKATYAEERKALEEEVAESEVVANE